MTKRLLTIAALVVLALACAPQMHAAIATELILADSFGDMLTIDVSDTNALTVTCNSGSCGNVAAKTSVDSAHGTISITHATFGSGANTFTISATGVGGADSFLPTLQDLNQIEANSNSSGGVLTATFTDTLYPSLTPTLTVGVSSVTDAPISASTIEFKVFTDFANTIPGGTLISDTTLTGHSSSNGGVNVANPNSSGSLTTQTIMTFTGTGSIQANISVANTSDDPPDVPEPASMILLGSLTVGLAVLFRRK